MTPALRQILFAPRPYSAEARAAFAAMTTQPSSGLKSLYNTCITSLINAGIWAKLDALYLMNVETAQAARLNIKNPGTYNLTAVSSPTFTAKTGYAGDGAAAYLDTNFNPTTASAPKFVQDSASAFVWSLQQTAENNPQLGQGGPSNTIIYGRRTTDTVQGQINTATTAAGAASTDGRGLIHANRAVSTAQELFKNGASVGTDAHASVSPVSNNIVFLRASAAFSAATVAMGGFGGALTSQNAADLYTALSAFKTGVDAL
jgi:hypothetical protein